VAAAGGVSVVADDGVTSAEGIAGGTTWPVGTVWFVGTVVAGDTSGVGVSWWRRAAPSIIQANGDSTGPIGLPPSSEVTTDPAGMLTTAGEAEAAAATAVSGADTGADTTATAGTTTARAAGTGLVAGGGGPASGAAAAAAVKTAGCAVAPTGSVLTGNPGAGVVSSRAVDADGAGARFLPALAAAGAGAGPASVSAPRPVALRPVTRPTRSEPPAGVDPALLEVAPLVPVDGAPLEAESSAWAIPALPPNRAAPIPRVNAAGPSHEYGWCAAGLRCRPRRRREWVGMLCAAMGSVPRRASHVNSRRGQIGIKAEGRHGLAPIPPQPPHRHSAKMLTA
jgi:hypothetical protein